MSTDRALSYARRQRPRFVEELKEFVRYPSISSQPRHSSDVKRCAGWLAAKLKRAGMETVEVVPTRGHPIVYAAWKRARYRPTVLIYGHYDVMPADPVREWKTPPFEPVVRGEDLYGRGSSDDKGQLFTHVKALESYLKSDRMLPVNVKCIFEGEEETGSAHLASFISRNKGALRADAAVMSDTRMLSPNRPAIGYSQRGVLMLELEVRGARHDLHSGNFGGAVHNSLQALCEILASLHEETGRIAIPGFYDKVKDWSKRERDYMARTGPPDSRILKDAQTITGWGEPGYSLYERTTIRPAFSVHGIVGGYQREGIKTVIPALALAKLTFRLVPEQDPDEVARLFREHIARVTPLTVKSSVRVLSGSKAAVVNRNQPALRAAAVAYRKGFGVPAVFQRSGGTIPVINTFQELLGIPTVLMGFGLPDSNIHAANEKFHLPNLYKGIATCIWFLAAAGAMLRQEDPAHQVAWSL
jgi:acetylornithine deacetylase/succinyl-diaminopimelate desuccinylase-like protein